MTQDFTDDMRAKLIAYLETHDLPSGLGDEESACTLAAIRLAYDGQLNDDVIDCMSPVLGKAAMRLQDVMPDEMRNSARYKALIPNMPGTGREREAERLDILIDWLRTVVLPQLQPTLLKGGPAYAVAADAADAAYAVADAAYAVAAAVAADAAAAVAADAAAAVAADAADADADAADADADAARAAARKAFWEAVDPIGVLERMTYLEKKE
jgi:hypothetical protein